MFVSGNAKDIVDQYIEVSIRVKRKQLNHWK